jgi:hypothetical protein
MSSAAHERSIEELRSIVAPVAEKYGVEKIYLFGSRARGDEKEGSDYDFSIVPGRLEGIIKLSGFILALSDALGTDVDVLPELTKNESLNREILRDRRLIYES